MNSTATNDTVTGHSRVEIASNICQCIILILTVFGNLMLILSLKIRKSGGLKLIDKLMLNTVVCNLLLVIFSIPIELALQHFYHYPFTDFACKLIDPMSTYFLDCCVFTYVAVAFERWIMVSTLSYGPPTKVQTLLVFLAIHVCALFSVIPYMPVLKVKNDEGRIVCDETWEISSRKSYTLSLFLLQYGVPVPLLVIFYTKTWFVVYHSNKSVFQSMLQSSINTMLTTGSPSPGNNGPDSRAMVTTSITKNASPELTSRCCREYSTMSAEDFTKQNESNKALLSPRYHPRRSSRRPRGTSRTASSISFVSPPASPLLSSYADPFESPPVSPLVRRDRRLLPRQRSFSERTFPTSPSPVVITKPRSGSEALGRRISRYFSITGGASLKECNQVSALKRREKQTQRLLIRFTIITLVFIVCMLPNQIHWLIIDFVEHGNEEFCELTSMLIHLITYANCVINPLLYGHYDRQFRRNVCTLIRSMKKRLLRQEDA